MLIVSKQHTLLGRTEMDVQELGNYPLLLPSTGFRVRRVFDEHFTHDRISPKILMEINDFPATVTMVKANNSATIGCRGYVANDPDVHLVTLTEAGVPLRLSKGIILSKAAPMNAAVRAFVELTKSQSAAIHSPAPGNSQ